MMDAFTPAEITSMMLKTGEMKAKQPYYVSFFKAFMAGWMVCFGALILQIIVGGSGSLRTDYPGLINLVGAFFFPAGLIMLALTGMELATGHFMFMPMALMKGRIKVWELPLNWIIVFFGNLAGALCFTAFMGHYSDIYSTAGLVAYSKSVAVAKTNERWGACLLRGIGCNFLVCMALWLGTGAREYASKIMALHFPVFVFVLSGFEHVVVNMFYIPIGIFNGAPVSIGRYIGHSMIPSLIGNIIGACLLGLPMVLFYTPLELPFYNRNSSPRPESSVVLEDAPGSSGTSGHSTPNKEKR